jgi:FkbM family methyltransferase
VHTVPLGLDIRTHADDVYFDVFFFHEYEFRETQLMLALLNKGDTVFDIGANFGWFSLNALKADPARWVWAFEPQPELCEELRANAVANGFQELLNTNLRVHEHALGASAGELQLTKSSSSSHALASTYGANENGARTTSVSVKTLDEIVDRIADQSRLPRFIKCDVEGAEMDVLRGSKRLCAGANKPVWLLEINHEMAARAGWKLIDMLNFLAGCGYSHFVFLSHARRPALVSPHSRRTNFIASRNGNIVAFARDHHRRQMGALEATGIISF